jgi:hypothetical protein
MSETEMQALLLMLKSLANETRIRILGLLIEGERSVGELAELLNLREPTISHHLAVMSEPGLVTMRAEGNTHYYSLSHGVLQRINRELVRPDRVHSLVKTEIEAGDRRVLSAFVDGEELKKIPDSLKKRMVVLKWLANKFDPGVDYSEAEINARIKRHHPDTATLRREMIQFKFMHRDHGIYRRIPDDERLLMITEFRGSKDALE